MTTQTYNTDPIEKLYNVVKQKGYYSGSIEDFKNKYNNPDAVSNLYGFLNKKQLYRNSREDFEQKYFPTLKKKGSGGGVLPSAPQSISQIDVDAVKSFVTGKPVEQIKQEKIEQSKSPVKITNAITQVKSSVPSEESVDKEAQKKIANISDEDFADPITGILKQSQANPTNPKDILATKKAQKIIESRIAPDGFEAMTMLGKTFFGGAENNKTSQLLKDKADKYNKSIAPLREIPVEGDLSQADESFLDYNYKDKLYSAAVQWYAEKNPSFKKELATTGIDAKDWANIRNQIGSGKMGNIISEYLSDNDVVTYLQKENPSLIPAFKHVEKNILKDNQDFAINTVANKVSKAVQKTGFNNIDPVFNFYGDNHKEFADQIANQILSPEELEVWNRDVRDNQEKYMDAPSLFQGIAEGGEGVFKGIGNTFSEPFRSPSESIKRRWEKESSHVSADPEGALKFMRDTGHVLGLVGAIAGTGNVLGGTGAGVYSKDIVPILSGGVLPFLGDSLEEGRRKYPDSPVKAWTSALFNTAMYAALSKNLFQTKNINQAIGVVKPEMSKIVERLASGSITREAARQEAHTLFKRAFDLASGTVTKAAKITGELTAIEAFDKGLGKIMMDDEFETFYPDQDKTGEAVSLFLSNLALGALSTYGSLKKRNRVAEESYYELASNPNKYERIINDLSIDKSFGTVSEFKENLKYIANVKKELDALKINPKDQKRFIFESLREKNANETAENTTDPSIKQKSKEVAKEAKEVKEKILEGEDAENVVTETQKKELEKQRETEVKIERLKKDKEFEDKKFEEQRSKLDGRTPEDKLKIEELEEKKKRSDEDFNSEMEKLSPAPKLPGIYGELYKSNPEEVLKDISKQAQNLNDKFEPNNDGLGNEENMRRAKEVFGEEIVNEAVRKYPAVARQEGSIPVIQPGEIKQPTETVTIKPKENVKVDDLDKSDEIRNRYIEEFNIVESSAFDWRVTSELSTADRKKAVADIRAGKDSAAARKLQREIDETIERGTVIINRGRGNHAQTVEIPVNEWFGLDTKEQNKVFEDADKLDENAVRIINESDITLQNIDNLKHLFNGFPYEQADFAAVKDYLARQGERNAETTQTSESGKTPKAETVTPAEETITDKESVGAEPPKPPPPKGMSEMPEGDGMRDLDKLANNVPDSGKVSEYMSKDTIEKYTGETPTNDQRRGVQELEIALNHGEKIIEKAQTLFGADYVEKTLDYIEQSSAPISNKALMYVSLENALGRDKLLSPERAAELTKQQALVYEQSQKFARENSLALNYQKLRRIAKVGYDIEKVTESFFSPEEKIAKKDIEKAVEADADTINKEAEKKEVEGMTPEVEKLVQEGVAKEIEKIYDKLPKDKKSAADKALAALESIQKKLRGKTYDAGLGIPVAIVDAGITTIKMAIKAGVKVADAIELGINKIKEKWGKEWAKEGEFREDLLEAFKNVKSTTDFVKETLIKKGFGREITVKGEKKTILDWKKLAGRSGTVSKISENVAEALKDSGMSSKEIDAMKDDLVKEYIDLRISVIEKAQTELARRNKENITPEQKSAAKKLAELYTYGLFESKENEFDIALNKALGAKVSDKGYSEAKEIAKAMETIYDSTFKGTKLNDISAKAAIEKLEDRLRVLLFRESRQQGNTNLKIATIVRNYFELQQTLLLNNLKQAFENPFSGLQQNIISKIDGVTSKEGVGTKEMAAQRSKIMREVYKDMVLKGGVGYGKTESTFVNRQHIDDFINKLSDNQLYHGIASVATGKSTLNAMDAMWKVGLTEKKFASNLIKVLTHETNKNRMSKSDAEKFVSEQLTGQTFADAQKTATEVINQINKDAGKELIPTHKEQVDRFANDIVKAALEMGGKLTADQINAAYNAAYHSASLNLGHTANNFLSAMIHGQSAKIEGSLNQAIKNKEWDRAALLTYYSVFYRNILNPFVGGGTNWLVLKFEKTGLGLLTGLAYKWGTRTELDLSTERGVKQMEDRLYNQSRIKDQYMRGLIGGIVTWTSYAAFLGLADSDEYRKWRASNPWAARYLDVITPESLLAKMAVENQTVKKYVSQSLNKNDAFDASTKVVKAADYFVKGETNEGWGALGEATGSKLNAPLPWRLVKDGQVIYQGVKGQDPYHGNYKPSTGFFNGLLQGGVIEYLGARPSGGGETPKWRKRKNPRKPTKND